MNAHWVAPSKTGSNWKPMFALICFLILMAGTIAAANDPWKSKDYKDWTQKDVDKVLTESPWVRVANTSVNGIPTGTTGSADDSAPSYGPSGSGDQNATPNGGRPGAQNPPGAAAQPGTPGATAGGLRFVVFWESSRTIREALARRQVLEGKMSEADSEKYLAQPQDGYQLVVQSENMSIFQKYDERFAQVNSSLKLKKSKRKLAPARVEFQKSGDGAVDAAVFSFPKKLPSGAPLILADEKSIEFTCKLGDVTLDVSFDPQKMADQTGPDL